MKDKLQYDIENKEFKIKKRIILIRIYEKEKQQVQWIEAVNPP